MTTVENVLIYEALELNKKYKEEKKKKRLSDKVEVKIEKWKILQDRVRAKALINNQKRKVSSLAKVVKKTKKLSQWVSIRKVKKKTKSRSQLVKELDAIFSRYIRLRDADDKGICTCITCSDKKPRKEMHNTHFISRSNYKYRRSVVNCWAGCYKCNVILHWNYIAYTLAMIWKYWEWIVREMQEDKELIKVSTPEIREMIEKYKYEVELLMKVKKV